MSDGRSTNQIELAAIEYITRRRTAINAMSERSRLLAECRGENDGDVPCCLTPLRHEYGPEIPEDEWCDWCKKSQAIHKGLGSLTAQRGASLRKLERAVVAGLNKDTTP